MNSKQLSDHMRSTLYWLFTTSFAVGFSTALVLTMMVLLYPGAASASASTLESSDIVPVEVKINDVGQGSLLFKTHKPGLYHSAPVLKTDVHIRANGMIARVKVVQRFKNNGNEWVEGVYVFPLPENAAVDHMRMRIGERVIEGKIKEKREARRIYTEARKAGKKTSLIEQQRPNIFTNSVANIGPNEEVSVEIEYQQTLRYDNGDFKVRFPMVVAPRYIPGKPVVTEESISAIAGTGWAADTDQVPDASRITPPVQHPSVARISHRPSTADADLLAVTGCTPSSRIDIESTMPSPSSSPCPPSQRHLDALATNGGEKYGLGKINPVSLHVELDAGFPLARVESPYHKVDVQRDGEGRASVTLTEGEVPADRDFELVWTPDSGHVPRAALFTEEKRGEMYSLLMIMPPTAGVNRAQGLSREVIYVIDTSGSMGGTSIVQAKRALKMALDRLKPGDRFNVIQFNSYTHKLFQQARIADAINLTQAYRYVDQLNANGGTEMGSALLAALEGSTESNSVRQVIFLTDGSVGNETYLFDIIKKRLGDSRLFTVGIGSAPNSHFMSKAALHGRGTFTYIGNVQEVQLKMAELFRKLESPVMSDLDIKWPEGVKAEVWPKRLPDLYLGEPLIFTAKTNHKQGDILLSGQRGNETWKVKFSMQGGRPGAGVGALWARSKISALMDSMHEGKDKQQVRKDVIDIALGHHLVSKYTSLVAVDVAPSRPRESQLKKKAVPTNLPAGWKHHKVFGGLPTTATTAELNMIIGLVLLLLGYLAYRKYTCKVV